MPNAIKARLLCMSHQNHHCQVAAISEFGTFPTRLVSSLHCSCCFLKMGTHMTRIVLSLRSLVPSLIDFRVGKPRPEDERFAATVVDIMTRHRSTGRKAKARQHGDADAQDAYAVRLRRLFGFWNGYTPGRLTHMCAGPGCCKDGAPEACQKMVCLLEDTLFSDTPTVPSMGKWTQLHDCLTWYCGFLVAGFGPIALKHAMQKSRGGEAAALPVDGESFLEQFAKEIGWQQVAGARYSATMADFKIRQKT